MPSRRTFAVLAFVVVSSAATPASASSCPMLTDPTGDGVHYSRVLSSPLLDIVSADVASGQETVVAALRLAASPTSHDPLVPLRMTWAVALEIDGVDYAFWFARSALGYSHGLDDEWGESVTPALTIDGSTITWSAPRGAFPALGGTGAIFRMTATSFLAGGNADTATTDATYRDREPGCIPAG